MCQVNSGCALEDPSCVQYRCVHGCFLGNNIHSTTSVPVPNNTIVQVGDVLGKVTGYVSGFGIMNRTELLLMCIIITSIFASTLSFLKGGDKNGRDYMCTNICSKNLVVTSLSSQWFSIQFFHESDACAYVYVLLESAFY